MRPFLLAVVLAGLFAAPAQAQLQSSNVSLLGKLPQSAGAIGARFSPDGDTMYVSSATGLQVYDVSAAATPRHIAQLPLPHFENEDVDVGRDTVVITNDPSFSTVGAIYLIDVADPANPVLRSRAPDVLQETGNGHIANCIAGLRLPLHDRHRRGPGRLRHPRPRRARVREDDPAAGRGLHARRPHRRGGHRVGDRRGRHVRLRRDRPAQPGPAVPLGPVDREHRRRAAGTGRLRPARLPAPQHAADVAR